MPSPRPRSVRLTLTLDIELRDPLDFDTLPDALAEDLIGEIMDLYNDGGLGTTIARISAAQAWDVPDYALPPARIDADLWPWGPLGGPVIAEGEGDDVRLVGEG